MKPEFAGDRESHAPPRPEKRGFSTSQIRPPSTLLGRWAIPILKQRSGRINKEATGVSAVVAKVSTGAAIVPVPAPERIALPTRESARSLEIRGGSRCRRVNPLEVLRFGADRVADA